MTIEDFDNGTRRNFVARRIALSLVLLASLASSALAQSKPTGQEVESIRLASLYPGAQSRQARLVDLPFVMSARDASAYRNAIKWQDQGQWILADRELSSVGDDILKGWILSQRYLSPLYKARFTEIKTWLDIYGDMPQAAKIRVLARKYDRAAEDPKDVQQDQNNSASAPSLEIEDDANWEDVSAISERKSSHGKNGKARSVKLQIRQALQANRLAEASRLLTSSINSAVFDDLDEDEMRVALANYAFANGEDGVALKWALPAAERSGDTIYAAHWVVALSHWRSGRPDLARPHFEKLANVRQGSSWMISAAAFWAARANLLVRRPETVNHWLGIAASHPRTFYGLLASRALNQDVWFGWDSAPGLTEFDVNALARIPAGKRALALLQIGETEEAENELLVLSSRATPALNRSILALADVAQMPELTVNLGMRLHKEDGRYHDVAAYPIPAWKPRGGWNIDKSLVMALVRQESSFDPSVSSTSGAKGLMQILPSTARFISKSNDFPDKALMSPEINLDLGQRYVGHLLKEDYIQNNLLFMAAAYNAGPGTLQRWLQSVKHHNDPLLFIESIPHRETRIFVEKVMTNFWIYQNRIGQKSSSLDQIVAGGWPIYDGVNTTTLAPKRN